MDASSVKAPCGYVRSGQGCELRAGLAALPPLSQSLPTEIVQKKPVTSPPARWVRTIFPVSCDSRD